MLAFYYFSQDGPISLVLEDLKPDIQIGEMYSFIKLDDTFGDFMKRLGMNTKSNCNLPKDDIVQTFTVIEETPTNPNYTMVIISNEDIIV